MDPVLGSVVGGKYRLERALARGGMGSVWAGRHIDLDSPIAIKFMGEPSAGGVTARTRFEREAKAAASLRSPHVVQVLDYDATGAMPYIMMELCEGEDLGQRLERSGRLSLARIAEIVRQLAKGLALAHEAGIVHRDLKPGNVFLAKVGQEELVKVLDFGVAKETRLEGSDTQTTTGVVVGSPSYMSPEQARGGQIDARSDLWSLGVLVFHAVTGKRPFQGANLGDVLVKICSDAIPTATSVAPDLPRAVDAFFERALCRSPDGRFQTASAFAEALVALAESEGAAPFREATGAGKEPTDIGSPRARDEKTGSLVAPVASLASAEEPTRIEPRMDRVEPPLLASALDAVGESPTTATSAHSFARAPAAKRSAAYWILATAAIVPALWFGSQRLFRAPATTSPAATSFEVATTTASAPAVATSVAASVAASAVPIALPGATTSATGAGALAPRDTPPSYVGPRNVKPRTPPTTTAIDPKFGLPTRAR